jgi:hypothetical protein
MGQVAGYVETVNQNEEAAAFGPASDFMSVS